MKQYLYAILLGITCSLQSYAPGGVLEREATLAELNNLAKAFFKLDSPENNYLLRVFMRRSKDSITLYNGSFGAFIQALSPRAQMLFSSADPETSLAQNHELPDGSGPFSVNEYLSFFHDQMEQVHLEMQRKEIELGHRARIREARRAALRAEQKRAGAP